MRKPYTKDQYVIKAKRKHGDKYNYDLVKYVDSKTKIQIICKKHNDIFEQVPSSHLEGSGCSKCAKEKVTKGVEKFIEEAQKVHNYKYTYNKSIYVSNKHDIIITCPIHGDFFQKVTNHLNGFGCKGCANISVSEHNFKGTEQFIKEAKEVHGDKYDYSLTEYTSALSKLKIICPIHGKFEQRAVSHLRGNHCNKCGINVTTEKNSLRCGEFIERSIKLHNNKYDYSKIEYVNSTTKISINCEKHGLFPQTPKAHLRGNGCPKCGRESSSEFRGLNSPGWDYNSWETKSKNSKYFKAFIVYIIKCTGNDEEFYKIGRTFRTIKKRFTSDAIPYKYEILNTIEFESARECCEYEQKLKNEHSEHKYLPNLKFGGMYECFSCIKIELIN